MDVETDFQRVMQAFAHYGVKKASMADLAKAAEVSRQTLYNRFGTKEAVLDWAIAGCVEQLKHRATLTLSGPGNATDRLAIAFDRWIGDMVPVTRNSLHGAEIMDQGIQSLQRQGIEPHLEFEQIVERFLLDQNLCFDDNHAGDTTFLLVAAAKGLMLKSTTSAEFSTGMERILRAIFPQATG